MSTHLNPYLGFVDNAREAVTFYHSVFGGQLDISTFGEFGMSDDPALADKVMHAQITSPSGLILMAADTPPGTDHTVGNNISVSLFGEDEDELRGYWDGLVAGGTITVPLELAPWGDTFGMLADKFGINWMVNVIGPKA